MDTTASANAVAATAQRGGQESMVKKHFEKVQAEKEELGITKLQASLPRISRPVLALALKDTNLDADKALLLLRQFQSDRFDELALLRKRRRRVELIIRHSASRGASSDGERDRSKKRKRKHKEEKSKKSKHVRKHSKRKKKRHRSGDSDDSSDDQGKALEFGSYGIIRENDYNEKRPEFKAWASEVKHIDIDSLPRSDERALFASFIEDFNTCTLPHAKYYDLHAHVSKGRASPVPGDGDGVAFVDDERLRRAELAAQRRREQDESARDALAKMLLSKEHLSELKDREMLRLQAQEAYKRGDMEKSAQLMKRLNADENETREDEPHFE